MLSINVLSVVVAAAVAFVLGFLFHGPLLGKLWMKLADIHPTGDEKFSDMYGKLFWNFVVNLITAYVLALVFLFISTSPLTEGHSIMVGIFSGVLVWAGFIATSTSIDVIWMGRAFKLWLFEALCSLVVMVFMGAIIAVW